MPTRTHPVDACPGALQLHAAADGGLARIRVPGGRLSVPAFRAVLSASASLGDGVLELTSRANLQIRALRAASSLGLRLAAAGLLPSATHERVRNIVASPLAGPVVRALVRDLDVALCARPALAGLPGRFLFAVDDGRGDVAGLEADVTAVVNASSVAVLLAGVDVGIRTSLPSAASLMLDCAAEFLALRADEWRIAELPSGPARIATALGCGPADPVSFGSAAGLPLGLIAQPDGLVALGAAVPLGRLTQQHGSALLHAAATEIVITPWRGVVLPDLPRSHAEPATLEAAGLLLDPEAPGVAISTCTGRPGCAHALADVRADATAMIAAGTVTSTPVHWSACPRRCGRPRGDAIDIIATPDGYTITRETR